MQFEAKEEIEIQWIAIACIYFIASAFTLFIFDYILTFRREVALVWQRNIGFGGALYFVARYSMGVSTMLHFGKKLGLYTNTKLGMQTILIMRAYAISSRNRYVLVLLVCLSIGSMIPASLVDTFTDGSRELPVQSNRRADSYHASPKHWYVSPELRVLSLKFTVGTENLITGLLTISFDIVLIVVTLYWTLEVRRHRIVGRFDKKSLMTLLVQQVYFAVCVLAHRNSGAPFAKPPIVNLSTYKILPRGFFNILLFHGQVSLTSRFFLDLRWRNTHPNSSSLSIKTPPLLTAMSFRVNLNAAARRAHDAITDEFGNSFFTRSEDSVMEFADGHDKNAEALQLGHHTLLVDPDDAALNSWRTSGSPNQLSRR
ncbi:hypothetical protein K439DRAFT_1612112 [Ramaria rubella]|nr:hypothetical protein K439DRAFT_1612112 [Ramaria rubella]